MATVSEQYNRHTAAVADFIMWSGQIASSNVVGLRDCNDKPLMATVT